MLEIEAGGGDLGSPARSVTSGLSVSGQQCLHLVEVELMSPGKETNVRVTDDHNEKAVLDRWAMATVQTLWAPGTLAIRGPFLH